MASEIERLIDMLSCGNTTPQERIRWAHRIVDLAHAEGAEQMKAEILGKSVAIIPKASVHVDDDGTVYVDPTAFIGVGAEAYGAKVYLVGASVLAPTKEKP